MNRSPKVENKYNLKPADITKLKILDRSKIKEPLFWYNNVINAWCFTKEIGSKDDVKYGTESNVWLGIYDEDAKAYKGKIRYSCEYLGSMYKYTFKTFFDPTEIDNENDLCCQEELLRFVNKLLDEGILEK